MKNGTVIPVFGEVIEIVASSTSTNHAFVIGVRKPLTQTKTGDS